jgi:hypothetical protein
LRGIQLLTAELLNAVEEFFDAIARHEMVTPYLYPTERSKGPRQDRYAKLREGVTERWKFDARLLRVDCADLRHRTDRIVQNSIPVT